MQRRISDIFVSILCIYVSCIFIIWLKENSVVSNTGPFKEQSSAKYVVQETPSITTASNLISHNTSAVLHSWVAVNEIPGKAFYYSAFASHSHSLRIFGATLRGLKDNLYCCFHANQSSKIANGSEGAKYGSLPESKGLRYSAAFFTCPLPQSSRPYAVSLSTNKCQNPSNLMPIVYPQDAQRDFTVCVTPLNYKYSKAYELVEMIELNRILGADHFVFYNYSTDHNVDKVLEYYKKLGIVEVLEWNLPMKVDTWPKKKNQPVEIHYFAQLAALNDCLYRNMYVSNYVVFQDLDEFIIPRKHDNWADMMENLPKGFIGAYLFRCVFFRKEWPDVETNFSGKDTALKYKMNTLLKQKREPKLLGKTHRSKYIVDPKQIDTVGIHNIWKLKPGARNHFVDPEYARMHHYRNWENPNDAKNGVLDDRILSYKDRLLQNTAKVWETLRNVPLGPLN